MLCSNKSRITYILLLLLTIIIIAIPSQVYGANWTYVCTSSSGIRSYYDSDSTRINKRDHIIKVWTKHKYLKSYKDNKRNEWTFLSDENWNKLDNTVTLYSYNYTDDTMLIANSVDYSYSGEVLYSNDSPGKWFQIVPESAGEAIFDKVIEAAGIKK